MMADLDMKNAIHSIIGWCAGLAIGTIGVSQNNIIIRYSLELHLVLSYIQMKKENSSSKVD